MSRRDDELGGEPACAAHLVDDEGSLDPHTATFDLSTHPPFRLDLTAWALRRRDGNVVDRWDADAAEYRRAITVGPGTLEARLTQVGTERAPAVRVRLRGPGAELLGTRQQVTTLLRRSLGLDVRLDGFYERAAGDAELGSLADRFAGVRPPRFHTWNEALVAAVSCQQLSLAVGITLLNRLAELCGERSPSGGIAFPSAERLATVAPEQLRALGYSNRKAEVIVAIADALASGDLALDGLEHEPDEVVVERLCELRGIGRWSAEYVLLRGLGRVSTFPGDDVGAQNKLRSLLGLSGPLDHEAVRELLARWDPWSGLIYFHLLLDGMAAKGLVEESA